MTTPITTTTQPHSHYTGGCHCGAVRFSIELPTDCTVDVERCNCSICTKSGFLHLIIPLDQFSLLTGADSLATYTFNTGVAKHTFCKVCGIKPFYTPRSNPTGIDINLNCLDNQHQLPAHRIVEFDGQQWEQNAHLLAQKLQGFHSK